MENTAPKTQNTASRGTVKFNYYDYTLLPEDKRYELIEGDLYMTPSPKTIHQQISAELGYRLTHYARKNRLGIVLTAPMDVVFSDEDVVQPDIIFISRERKGIIEKKYIRGAPDLLIEILSPATAERDLVIKKKLYFRFGVKEYWIVDPEAKTVEVMVWSDSGFKTVQVYPEGASLRSAVLPDFTLPVGELFEPLF